MERCLDNNCGFENRAEYCEREITLPDGDAQMVVDLLDSLLYENDQVSSQQYTMHVSQDSQRLEWTFTVMHSDFKTWIWPLTETTFKVCHEIDKKTAINSYQVEVSWAVRHDVDTLSEPFTITYAIDRFLDGTIRGTVEQLDLAVGRYAETAITLYDYFQLFDMMTLVDSSQSAERADNARALSS